MGKSNIYRHLEKLNHETKKIHESLSGLSEDQLHDTSYGWSLIQVMGHLKMTEAGSVLYMKKKMNAGDKMTEAGIGGKFRLLFSDFFLQSNLKWKVPKKIPKAMASPDNVIEYTALRNEWDSNRSQLKEYVDHYPNELLNKEVYKHPFAGRQTLKGALVCFIAHQRHHVHQIKRIRKKIGA